MSDIKGYEVESSITGKTKTVSLDEWAAMQARSQNWKIKKRLTELPAEKKPIERPVANMQGRPKTTEPES